jgi:hypothetical protein
MASAVVDLVAGVENVWAALEKGGLDTVAGDWPGGRTRMQY